MTSLSQSQDRIRKIDFARGIAIISVVLYHFYLPATAYLYVGVDIFFILAGYLTCHSIEEHTQRTTKPITIVGPINYLKRRYLNIFDKTLPAVLLCFTAYAASGIGTGNGVPITEQAFFSLLGIQNVYLWLHTSYFETSARLNPFLPLWSLSLEIQIYLVICLIPLLAQKIKRGNFLLFILFSALASILLHVSHHQSPAALFYLPITRIWEFLIGAYMYYQPAYANTNKYTEKLIHHVAKITFLILVSITQKLEVILACLFAIFILSNNVKIRISSKAIEVIGRHSLVIFLNHFWALTLFKNYFFKNPTLSEGVTLILFSIISGIIFTRIVIKHVKTWKAHILALIFFCTLILSESTNPTKDLSVTTNCSPLYNLNYDPETCKDVLETSSTTDGQTLLIGDSWAKPFVTDERVHQAYWYPGCPPTTTLQKSYEHKNKCAEANQRLLNHIKINQAKINRIIAIYRIPFYLEGPVTLDHVDEFTDRPSFQKLPGKITATSADIRRSMLDYLSKVSTIRNLTIITGIPEFGANPHHYKSLHGTYPTIRREDHDKRTHQTRQLLADVQAHSQIEIIDVSDYFCDHDSCSPNVNDKINHYDDDDHLNEIGASMLLDKVYTQ